MINRKKCKVFVGVSGGVDSSVALALLKNDGYDVTGVFLKVWHPDFLACDWKEERRSAMRVCATLGVPFLTFDCQKEYKKEVADYMIDEYREGRTPNPDIFCNKYVKFGIFLKKAIEMGADFVATGHYAQVVKTEQSQISFSPHHLGSTDKFLLKFSSSLGYPPCEASRNDAVQQDFFSDNFELYEAIDENKDQSYFLYTLNQEQLSHILFPIGHLKKPQVRKLAEKFNLPTANKKDSQGVCFLGKLDMKEFLSHYIKAEKGKVLNTKGEEVGYHNGAVFYTIGERHGFVITKKSANDPRYFVVSKDLTKNTITVANKKDESDAVFSTKEIIMKDIHFIQKKYAKMTKCEVRIRYRQEKQKCEISREKDGWHILFKKAQNGVAVGQSAVLYLGQICLGGGIISIVR